MWSWPPWFSPPVEEVSPCVGEFLAPPLILLVTFQNINDIFTKCNICVLPQLIIKCNKSQNDLVD